eukprot:UN14437
MCFSYNYYEITHLYFSFLSQVV